jgi:hypothetical protein
MRATVVLFILSCFLLVGPVRVVAQGSNGVSSPAPGDTVAGIVIIEGTAADPNFLRYELAFFFEGNPGAGWIVFAEGDQSVTGGTLAVWDTTVGRNVNAPVFPDGVYQLRLRVVKSDYNYNEYFTGGIIVSNGDATPTATPGGEATEAAQTATPVGGPTQTAIPLDILPTLTPFPTPSRQPTPADGEAGAAGPTEDESGNGDEPGLIERVTAVDTSQFGRAFWRGAMISGYIFAILAGYLLLRTVGRRLWRLFVNILSR